MFPTADQVAIAIVTACKLTGDMPISTCLRQQSRARNIAMQALMNVFPDARRQGLARCCGYPTPATGTTTLNMARKASWWREVWVDEVIGALAADQYGDQAQ